MNSRGDLSKNDLYGGTSLFGPNYPLKNPGGTEAYLSGTKFEMQVYERLRQSGYPVTRQRVMIPSIYGDGHKRVDIHVFDPGIAISCRNQEERGSVEDKLWGELIQLQHLCDNQEVVNEAWLVLGGTGMKHIPFWMSKDWKDYISAPDVKVFHFDSWILEPRLI